MARTLGIWTIAAMLFVKFWPEAAMAVVLCTSLIFGLAMVGISLYGITLMIELKIKRWVAYGKTLF